jgi:DNA-directed RNA polymerase specialized sigma24 family protein
MTAALGFLAASIESPEWFEEPWDSGRNPDLWLYRQRTAALLRRFFRMSLEMGKLPSILGQEFFRSKVTSYKASSFEDVVIFVHDVERSLGRLDRLSQALIGRVALQGFSHEEAGRLLGLCRKTVERRFWEISRAGDTDSKRVRKDREESSEEVGAQEEESRSGEQGN